MGATGTAQEDPTLHRRDMRSKTPWHMIDCGRSQQTIGQISIKIIDYQGDRRRGGSRAGDLLAASCRLAAWVQPESFLVARGSELLPSLHRMPL